MLNIFTKVNMRGADIGKANKFKSQIETHRKRANVT